jgi:hypothetical protein
MPSKDGYSSQNIASQHFGGENKNASKRHINVNQMVNKAKSKV